MVYLPIPLLELYYIYTYIYICVFFIVNVGKIYQSHASYGIYKSRVCSAGCVLALALCRSGASEDLPS